MAEIVWRVIDRVEDDWEYRLALIEALREIAEQIASINQVLNNRP